MINPQAVVTMLMAGLLFTLAAGLYAFFYALGKFWKSFFLELLSFLFAFLMVLSGFVLVACPTFTLFWKLLLAVSILAYLIIPRGMIWVVQKLHQKEKKEDLP
ncbi:hypothetical protein [Candidatus Methylacidiphilum infernorum]|nr:hypothetical protein [Candidatus Methylacidiphilum infernorum]